MPETIARLPELIRDAQAIPFARTIPITMALPIGAHLNVPLVMSDGRSTALSAASADLPTIR